MADFPDQGGDTNTWGTMLINFFKKYFNMSGDTGGTFADLCYENELLCYENELMFYVEN